jgi:hypothetical protein
MSSLIPTSARSQGSGLCIIFVNCQQLNFKNTTKVIELKLEMLS